MGSALKWGFLAVGGLLGSMLLALLLSRLIGLTLTLVFLGLAIPTFLIAVGVVLVRRAVRFGIDKFNEITGVPATDRFDNAAAFEADLARAAEGNSELEQAAERIRRIKKAAHGLYDVTAGRAMERVADAARTLLTQASEDRGAARRLRHPLVHQLGHVEAVALNLMRMQEGGVPDQALIARATSTFVAVADDFERHRRSAAAAHALETEARLELLSQEVDAGVKASSSRPPPPPAAAATPAAASTPAAVERPKTEPAPSVTPVIDQLFNRTRG